MDWVLVLDNISVEQVVYFKEKTAKWCVLGGVKGI